MGLAERRSVIDTIPRHGYAFPVGTKFFDESRLGEGLDARLERIQPELPGDSGSRAFVVTSEHLDFEAQRMEILQRGGACRFDGIEDSDQPIGHSVASDEENGFAVLLELDRRSFQMVEAHDFFASQKLRLSDHNLATRNISKHTSSWHGAEVGGR